MAKDHLIVSLKYPNQEKEEPVAPQLPPTKKQSSKITLFFAVLFLVGAGFGGVYWYNPSLLSLGASHDSVATTSTNSNVPNTSTDAVEQEVRSLVEEVGKIILLPEGEVPTVATVSDPSKLTDQAFFAHAKVGDKVLLYTKARKAFLYDPKQHRLVEVAPITTDMQP